MASNMMEFAALINNIDLTVKAINGKGEKITLDHFNKVRNLDFDPDVNEMDVYVNEAILDMSSLKHFVESPVRINGVVCNFYWVESDSEQVIRAYTAKEFEFPVKGLLDQDFNFLGLLPDFEKWPEKFLEMVNDPKYADADIVSIDNECFYYNDLRLGKLEMGIIREACDLMERKGLVVIRYRRHVEMRENHELFDELIQNGEIAQDSDFALFLACLEAQLFEMGFL